MGLRLDLAPYLTAPPDDLPPAPEGFAYWTDSEGEVWTDSAGDGWLREE
jgi:hypothetical protein